jgi:REP element-mobilizing transposase RayT
MDSMQPSSYYHVFNHANGNENLFREEENYRFFLGKYDFYIPPVAETLAYCLMPNHFHLLLKIKTEEQLLAAFPKFKTLEKLLGANCISKQFSNLFSSYTQSYNKKYDRAGSLFMKNFKRETVSTDSYFSKIIHYIHANPVHHGFVDAINKWRWSSYNTILSNADTKINRKEVLQWFNTKEGFIQFHQQPVYLKTKEMFE